MDPARIPLASVDGAMIDINADQPRRAVRREMDGLDSAILPSPFEEAVRIGDDGDVKAPGFLGRVGMEGHFVAFCFELHQTRAIGCHAQFFQALDDFQQISRTDLRWRHTANALRIGRYSLDAVFEAAVTA